MVQMVSFKGIGLALLILSFMVAATVAAQPFNHYFKLYGKPYVNYSARSIVPFSYNSFLIIGTREEYEYKISILNVNSSNGALNEATNIYIIDVDIWNVGEAIKYGEDVYITGSCGIINMTDFSMTSDIYVLKMNSYGNVEWVEIVDLMNFLMWGSL